MKRNIGYNIEGESLYFLSLYKTDAEQHNTFFYINRGEYIMNENPMINLTLSIPSEILLALRENENQLASYMKKYTALNLFQSQKLSIGQCAILAEMTEEDFIYFLGENKVSIFEYLDGNALREELENA